MKLIVWLWVIAILICLFVMSFLVSGTASAQGVVVAMPIPCNETKALLGLLTSKYHEEAVGGGLSGAGEQVRLFVSDTNTFSIVVTKPGGLSCLYTGGNDWTEKPAKIKGDSL